MNDRFKFKAWNKRSKEMRTVDHFYIKAGELYMTPDKIGDVCCWHIDDCELMQCTGLKDKNGNLIFEGDICKIKVWFGSIYSICNLPIIFKDGIFGYELYEGSGDYGMMRLDGHEEVVGNIYENPELIQGKAK